MAAVNGTVCKDREMALAILRIISEGMKTGTQKTALESVMEWLQEQRRFDIPLMTTEERTARIIELLEKARYCPTTEEREGISA